MKKLVSLRNKKGFTLVELIIVIAIIAVLAAVVAPQYIKYVEKSRIGVDEQYISEVGHNIELVAASNPDVSATTVTLDPDGTITTTDTVLQAALNEVFPAEAANKASRAFKSDEYKGKNTDATKVKIVLTANGTVTYTNCKNLTPTTPTT